MKAGILAIGTELLMGKTVNTNATYLSQELHKLGISVYYHYTVGDNPERIAKHFKQLMEMCDLVFTTGGLGPTLDDITKEIIADVLGLDMVLDPHSLERIKTRFKMFNREMPESNTRQAYFPEGAIILDNEQGTAPACIIEAKEYNTGILVMPGPPKELKHIFESHIAAYLKNKALNSMTSKYLSIYDLGESAVEDQLMDLIQGQSNPTLATYAGDGKVLLRITSSGLGDHSDKHAVERLCEQIKSRIGDYIVSENGEDLEVVVMNQLLARGIKIAFAESCTGGLLSYTFIRHPGASDVVATSLVTYSNLSKSTYLGVKTDTLTNYGAVSHQTCYEMVKGVAESSGAEIAISTTGIAGPGGGSSEKPVGLVYIGIYYNGEIMTVENKFTGDRESIQRRTVNKALKLAYDLMN
ncbi:competence/damage-inducible protein A [Fusibacter tunisiensis]|uniref:Putative competence-damage inducible protein n=1 Tax=Fusibacter tunisiensis TaxID=1008308 RepID=A0ABS2MML0_9FIRM|nr:competence/damage-inducible protein A [Fusibacter tunisiensis]MBM7560641.1 nicotinamide-nucleotide amidase [Fusibacter tunisiensis]